MKSLAVFVAVWIMLLFAEGCAPTPAAPATLLPVIPTVVSLTPTAPATRPPATPTAISQTPTSLPTATQEPATPSPVRASPTASPPTNTATLISPTVTLGAGEVLATRIQDVVGTWQLADFQGAPYYVQFKPDGSYAGGMLRRVNRRSTSTEWLGSMGNPFKWRIHPLERIKRARDKSYPFAW